MRVFLVDETFTHGAVVTGMKIMHDARATKRMKAFYYGGCVNQIPATQHACQIRIQLLNRHPGIFHHGVDPKNKSLPPWKDVHKCGKTLVAYSAGF